MSVVKEFLATRIKKNCAWYAIPMSVLFTWRYTHLRQIPFDSTTYFVFLAATYTLFMIIFFVLFAIARKKAIDAGRDQ
jgi:hypothetical protein